MVLSVVVPGKAYWQLLVEDIPCGWILGGYCLVCGHTWPVDMKLMRARNDPLTKLRHLHHHLKCRSCGNPENNHFTIYGRHVRAAPAPVAGVEDGEPGRLPSLHNMMDNYASRRRGESK